MGNCIRAAFSHIDEDEESKVLTSNKKLSSKLCRRNMASSQTEEIEHLIQKRSSHSLRLPERVRIVVNKKQFERLIGCVEEVQLRRMVLESLLRRAKKWRPSLAAIPEL
ncbi:hypothetical protein C2S52_013461 [Perilla frutescens var. hirtella]|nr:hypothetical protein C2S51_015762 [Perilla frutescens var. frutescens]KAH6775900.1 hypothetical protein C2S52_013461 [Perilla frutescens var. hirtella]